MLLLQVTFSWCPTTLLVLLWTCSLPHPYLSGRPPGAVQRVCLFCYCTTDGKSAPWLCQCSSGHARGAAGFLCTFPYPSCRKQLKTNSANKRLSGMNRVIITSCCHYPTAQLTIRSKPGKSTRLIEVRSKGPFFVLASRELDLSCVDRQHHNLP